MHAPSLMDRLIAATGERYRLSGDTLALLD